MTPPPPSRAVALLRLANRRLGSVAYRASEVCFRAAGVRIPETLLILRHMRSGSSLLLHLMLTNRQISALGERNCAYATSNDLLRLRAATRFRTGTVFTPIRYVADQINHNRFTPNPDLLAGPGVRTVFLLREPRASLASLMELSRVFYGHSWTVSRAVDYYVTRLQFLAALGNGLAGRARPAFVTYEQLIASTAPTLARLQVFLGLASGFATQYERQPFTGRRGDPGTKISQGRVAGINNHDTYEVPAENLEQVRQAYAHCRRLLEPFVL